MTAKDIVITCGGTGGHIYPGIALAQHFEEYTCCFIGTRNRIDSTIIPNYGFTFKGLWITPRNPLSYLTCLIQAVFVLAFLSPKAVICTGGYNTLPVGIAAWLLRLPLYLCEQNIIPGQTNRFLGRIADKIYLAFNESLPYFSIEKTKLTGNPIRKYYLPGFSIQTFTNTTRLLLVFGGSQGASFINDLVINHSNWLLDNKWSVLLITGSVNHRDIQIEKNGHQFIAIPYAENMDELYQAASAVISRAGATTVAELSYYQVPAFLIPYPYAKDNHQVFNAAAYIKQFPESVYEEESNLKFSHIQDFLMKVPAKKPLSHRLNPAENIRLDITST